VIDACKWVKEQFNHFELRSRKCANEKCRKTFYLGNGNRSSKKFCSEKCAGAKRTRKYRERLNTEERG